MAMVYKPKRTDVGYKRILYFHFFTFAIVSEVGAAVGNFRQESTFAGGFAIFRIPIWCLIFFLALRLRESAAKLSPQELSNFLCQAVLVKGTTAMGTMLFFSFEAVSCFISQDSFSNGQCSNTSHAANFLSVYVAILASSSIISKTVPKSVQREVAWKLTTIASLKGLKWWQRLQGGLITITAIASLNLLSNLGVEGDESSMIRNVGAMGGIGLIVASLINVTMLVRIKNQHQRQQQRGDVEMPTKRRSVRRFSSGQVEDNMFAAALV